MRYILTLFLVSMLYASCEDYGYHCEYDPSNGLPFLINTRADTIQKKDLCNYCYIYYDSLESISTVSWDSTTIAVKASIEDMVTNDTFALVSQKPVEKIYEYIGKNKIQYVWSSEKEMVEEIDYFEYWIIFTQKDIIYGPLSLSQFNFYRQKLGVPNNLRLDFEKSTTSFIVSKIKNSLQYILIITLYIFVLVLIIILLLILLHLFSKFILRIYKQR